MKIFLTSEDIISNIEDHHTNNLERKYEAWQQINDSELSKFKQVGRIAIASKREALLDSPIDYWSKKYPINFACYPYHSCDLYVHEKYYFMIYMEFGGHVPELRCRLIQKHLITH